MGPVWQGLCPTVRLSKPRPRPTARHNEPLPTPHCQAQQTSPYVALSDTANLSCAAMSIEYYTNKKTAAQASFVVPDSVAQGEVCCA